MEAATVQHEENHFIQLMPLEFDAHVQEAHSSHYIYGSEKLQKSHQNLLKLHRSLHRFHSSQQSSAHMITSPVTPNSNPPDLHCNGAAKALEHSTGGKFDRDSAINACEGRSSALRRGKEGGSRSPRSKDAPSAVALLRQSSCCEATSQSFWTMGSLPCVQSEAGVHASSGRGSSNDQGGERAPSDSHAAGVGDYAGRSSSVSGALFGNAEEGGCRDAAGSHGGQAPLKSEYQVFRHSPRPRRSPKPIQLQCQLQHPHTWWRSRWR